MLTPCPECQGKISSSAARCPHCGFEFRSCPECGGMSPAKLDTCKQCGFPIKPLEAPRPAETSAPRRRRWIGVPRGRQMEEPEPTAALVCAILGLFIPILSAVGLSCSRPGTPARVLSIIGLILWIASILLLFVAYR